MRRYTITGPEGRQVVLEDRILPSTRHYMVRVLESGALSIWRFTYEDLNGSGLGDCVMLAPGEWFAVDQVRIS